MKKLLFAVTVIGISAATAFAAGNATKANVPFDFAVGGSVLTAGAYTVEDGGNQGILMIRDADGRIKALFMVDRLSRIESNGQATWEFNRYGDRYFLSRVWGPGESGAALHKTRIERELVASSATSQPNQVLVVAAVYR